jgi:hypothetical protein
MPFSDGAFDAIIATFPAEYILKPQTLREARRLLRHADQTHGKTGSAFVIVGLCFDTDRPWLRRLVGWLYGPPMEQALVFYRPLAEGAGLSVRVVRDLTRHFRLPLFVLEPRGDA